MNKTTKELVRQCLKCDKAAQYELVHRYAGGLMAICRRYARDESMAEDMLQETWIKIFKNLDSYRFLGPFEGWIRRITVNTALQWKKKVYYQREAQTLDLVDRDSGPPSALTNLQTEDLLYLVKQLPAGFQEVFNLYVIDGYKHKEIADLLGIGESTSRTILLRARNLLKRKVLLQQTKRTAI